MKMHLFKFISFIFLISVSASANTAPERRTDITISSLQDSSGAFRAFEAKYGPSSVVPTQPNQQVPSGFDQHLHNSIMSTGFPPPSYYNPPPANNRDASNDMIQMTPTSVPFWREIGSKTSLLQHYAEFSDRSNINTHLAIAQYDLDRVVELARLIKEDYQRIPNRNRNWTGISVLDRHVAEAKRSVFDLLRTKECILRNDERWRLHRERQAQMAEIANAAFARALAPENLARVAERMFAPRTPLAAPPLTTTQVTTPLLTAQPATTTQVTTPLLSTQPANTAPATTPSATNSNQTQPTTQIQSPPARPQSPSLVASYPELALLPLVRNLVPLAETAVQAEATYEAGTSLATRVEETISARAPPAATGPQVRTEPRVYHRLANEYTQTPADADIIEISRELHGGRPMGSNTPTVQAYLGPLPEGAEGIEFTTEVIPSAEGNGLPGAMVRWAQGTEGVSNVPQTERVSIPVEVIRRTQ